MGFIKLGSSWQNDRSLIVYVCGENLSLLGFSLTYPSYAWHSNVSYVSVQNLAT